LLPNTPKKEPEMQPASALSRALALWAAGKRIPLNIAADLMEQGYDVPSLERRHLKGT
jgi:hypothetical protein